MYLSTTQSAALCQAAAWRGPQASSLAVHAQLRGSLGRRAPLRAHARPLVLTLCARPAQTRYVFQSQG